MQVNQRDADIHFSSSRQASFGCLSIRGRWTHQDRLSAVSLPFEDLDHCSCLASHSYGKGWPEETPYGRKLILISVEFLSVSTWKRGNRAADCSWIWITCVVISRYLSPRLSTKYLWQRNCVYPRGCCRVPVVVIQCHRVHRSVMGHWLSILDSRFFIS